MECLSAHSLRLSVFRHHCYDILHGGEQQGGEKGGAQGADQG